MDSLKRYAQDLLVDSNTRVIRSHRKPPTYTLRKPLLLLLAGSAICSVLTSAVGMPVSAEPRASTPVVAAPKATELPTLDAPASVLPTAVVEAREEALRVSRGQPRQAPKPEPVEIVVSYALAQLGDRYRWASAGPNSFDCSGLALAAYEQIGIHLPHYTGWMLGKGSKVSRAELKRGDLVFPSYGHVGIYLGDNQMVAASSSKGRVIIQQVYAFYAARRYV